MQGTQDGMGRPLSWKGSIKGLAACRGQAMLVQPAICNDNSLTPFVEVQGVWTLLLEGSQETTG